MKTYMINTYECEYCGNKSTKKYLIEMCEESCKADLAHLEEMKEEYKDILLSEANREVKIRDLRNILFNLRNMPLIQSNTFRKELYDTISELNTEIK